MNTAIRIEHFRPEHAARYESLNRAWLVEHELIEPADEPHLTRPMENIIEPGGAILVALNDDDEVIGTCAIVPHAVGEFELVKMAVAPSARGQGIGRQLIEATLDGEGPRSRNLPAMAFDSRRNVLVLYGGTGVGSGTKFGDTWEWDGQRWHERSVRTPGPRDHHAMAFDEARGNTVMYGGSGGSGLANGTWTWDGTEWTLVDSTSGPGPLVHHAMSYDRRRGRIVMYGGINSANQRQSDTWEWDGRQWHRASVPDSPGPRSHHRMAFDARSGVTVLFGGGDTTATATWTYDGTAWRRHDVVGPDPRWSSAMAYDATRARVVLFGGGQNARPYGSHGDTWTWDGAVWMKR